MLDPISLGISKAAEGLEKAKEISDVKNEGLGSFCEQASVFQPLENFDPYEPAKQEGMAPQDTEQVERASQIINETQEFNPVNWENLNVNQRLDALNQLEQNVAAITGRDACTITAEDLGSQVYGYTQGSKIVLNSSLLSDGSGEGLKQCLDTTLHEGRHAYQNYNVEVREIDQNSELVNSWKLNYDMGYENGNCGLFDFQKMGLKRYIVQPVEVDARVFAESVLDKTNYLGDVRS